VWSEFIGDLVILFSAFFAVLGRDALSPGLVGLSLSFALQVIVMLRRVLSLGMLEFCDSACTEFFAELAYLCRIGCHAQN